MLLSGALLVACGETTSPDGGPVARLSISTAGVRMDGGRVTLAQLDARLADLQEQGGKVVIDQSITASSSPGELAGYTTAQREKIARLQRRVLAVLAAHDLPVVSVNMPVVGSASPHPSPPSGP
jgi:hypothetical protein